MPLAVVAVINQFDCSHTVLDQMVYYRATRRAAYRRRAPIRRRRSYASTYVPRPRVSSRRIAPRRTTRPRAMSAAEPSIGRSGSKYIHAQADPFSEQVDGVKIPDANSQPSVAIKAEDAWTMSTGAVQTSTFASFNPSTSKMFVQGVYASATSCTWTAAFGGSTSSSKNSKLISDMELVRPVAHAVRITSGLAPTTTTGFVHVAVFTQALYNQSTWTYPTTIADLSNVPGYNRIPIARLTAEGLTIVNRPLDCTSQRYVDTDSGGYNNADVDGFHVPYQWGSICVAVEGAPASSTVLSVESILHMECIPRATSISTPSPAASYSPAALGGASNSLSKTVSTFLDGDKSKRVQESVSNAKRGIQKATGNYQSRQFSSFQGLTSRTGRFGAQWQKQDNSKAARQIGIPGVNDRQLPAAGRADVRM